MVTISKNNNHEFDGGYECVKCHTNLLDEKFFNNTINSLEESNGLGFKFGNMPISEDSSSTASGEIVLKPSDKGVEAYGVITIEGEDGGEFKFNYSNGTLNAIAEGSDGAGYIAFPVYEILDYYLTAFGEGDFELPEFESDLVVLDEVEDGVSNVKSSLKDFIMSYFKTQETSNGYKFSFNYDVLRGYSQIFNTTKLQKLVDLYLGDGSYVEITNSVKSMLDMTIGDIFENVLGDAEIPSMDDLLEIADALVNIITEGEYKSFIEYAEAFTGAEIGDLDGIIEACKDKTVVDIVSSFMGITDPSQIKTIVNMAFSTFANETVYGVIAQLMTNEEKMVTSEEIKSMVDGIINTLENMLSISFTTDKNGAFIGFEIDFSASADDDGMSFTIYNNYESEIDCSDVDEFVSNNMVDVDFSDISDEVLGETYELIKDGDDVKGLTKNITYTQGEGQETTVRTVTKTVLFDSVPVITIVVSDLNGVEIVAVPIPMVISEGEDLNITLGYIMITLDWEGTIVAIEF